MKRRGCSIIFVNGKKQVLLFLRDNKPEIPFPNMWDVPGGHVEETETPDQCIIREMKEEMGMDLKEFQTFSIEEFNDRIEYSFWKKEDIDIDKIKLTEGQYLRWFNENEVKSTELAYGFNKILVDFFAQAPFMDRNQEGV